MSDIKTDEQASAEYDHDIVIVGGGPAGCSAGVFCAREGLDTVIFDRGRSSLLRCGHLENYLGFPAGIDIETFYELMHDHAETAGCEIVPDMVESVDRADGGEGFVVELQERAPVTARRVVAATRYHTGYMRGLDDERVFEAPDSDHVDPEFADHDGTTPIDGLYVASLTETMSPQVAIAVGRGARVGRRVVADARLDDGWWEATATRTDWIHRRAELGPEFDGDREPWLEWFDRVYAEDAPADPESDRYQRVREQCTDNGIEVHLTEAEIDARRDAGHEAMAEHLDVDRLVAAVDADDLLAAIDDEAIDRYRTGTPHSTETSN